jgi:carbamoyl-phosphate synthase small subunit
MRQIMDKTAYLVLADGTIYKGKRFGADGCATAEVVFTTATTGYLETLTDRSYHGQMIVQAFPLIGNYGVIPEDLESDHIECAAYIVREWSRHPSNFRSRGDIDAFLRKAGIPGLCGIDTRALVRRLRESGVMNGILCDDPADVDFAALRGYKIENAVSRMSCKEAYVEKLEGAKYHVALMDYGIKENILRMLKKCGCEVTVLPYNTEIGEIIALHPDGMMLSNGPGDPTENPEIIAVLRELLNTGIPTFGICLGHQLLALAAGFKTVKLKYGHRGANQPVRDTASGRVYITSQNHGYAVLSETIDPEIASVAFENNNDRTNEGIAYVKTPAFTVQFHPEASAGPQDTAFLFERFLRMMDARKEG